MTLRTTSLTLATAIVALGVTSLADGASAQRRTNWIPLADPAGGPNFYPLAWFSTESEVPWKSRLDEKARYRYRRDRYRTDTGAGLSRAPHLGSSVLASKKTTDRT